MEEKQPIDYASPDLKTKRHIPLKKIAIGLLVSAFVVFVVALLGVPKLNQIRCANNMGALSCAIYLYHYHQDSSRLNAVNLPNLQALMVNTFIGSELFICPSSSDTKATGSSGAQLSADMAKPGHCSYIYVGAGMRSSSPPTAILMLEDPANHNLAGGHVLYANHQVQFLPLSQLMPCFNDLAAGRNPPTSPAVTTSAARDDYKKNWQSRMPLLKTGLWAIPAAPGQELKEADELYTRAKYCVEAIRWFKDKPPAEVRRITPEIATLLGKQRSLDVNDPSQKYTLPSIPGNFSGLQLLCYMYVGFRILDPESHIFPDLSREYSVAQAIVDLGPDHPDVDMSLENMAALCRKIGRTQEAQKLEARAAATRATKR